MYRNYILLKLKLEICLPIFLRFHKNWFCIKTQPIMKCCSETIIKFLPDIWRMVPDPTPQWWRDAAWIWDKVFTPRGSCFILIEPCRVLPILKWTDTTTIKPEIKKGLTLSINGYDFWLNARAGVAPFFFRDQHSWSIY